MYINDERARFDAALAAKNIGTLIGGYPVRETPALKDIAKKLGFQDRGQYEGAVRKLLLDDPSALVAVRALFGELEAKLV